MSAERVPEAVLARIWNDGWHSREMRTVDGYRVAVVYRGVWTHSNGPDFRDAMLELDGRLVRGSVELHVRSSEWHQHGHAHNTDYDDVVLHVVLHDDAVEPCTGPGGRHIPTLAIEPYLRGPIESFVTEIVPLDLGRLGSTACLPTLAGNRPDMVRAVLRQEGWLRMQSKQLRFQQDLAVRTPGEVLYRGLLDSFGLSSNREGMAAVAERVPLELAERIVANSGAHGALAALLGTASFLPLSPAHAVFLGDDTSVVNVERTWGEISAGHLLDPIPASIWNLNRVRPLNHPARRLASMAALLVSVTDAGLVGTVINGLSNAGRVWDAWLAEISPAIGASRRQQIMINTLAPFVTAYAEMSDDAALLELCGEMWETLPGSIDDAVAWKTIRQITGGKRFPVRLALEEQGLHQIGRHGCADLRCFECPVAALAMRYETPLLTEM